jgi:hypothetical protein
MTNIAEFAGYALALYAAHHVGDYWVQTHSQSMLKGTAGAVGRGACRRHVASYLLTQALFLTAVCLVTGAEISPLGEVLALAVSGLTHYAADRREHGIMFKLARWMPWKAGFVDFGTGLATGAWALDQSWHIFWGVFVAGLLCTI